MLKAIGKQEEHLEAEKQKKHARRSHWEDKAVAEEQAGHQALYCSREQRF